MNVYGYMTKEEKKVLAFQLETHPELYIVYFEEKARRRKLLKGFSDYRTSAKRRNLIFTLTLEEFEDFYGGNCYYCGEEIDGIGLDRIDNEKGYTKDNVVRCCGKCNFMKQRLSKNAFVEQCKKIAQNFS